MYFNMNQFMWLTTPLVIQPLTASSGLFIVYLSFDLHCKFWNVDKCASSPWSLRPADLQVWPEPHPTFHHLTLFHFHSSAFVLFICHGSVYIPPPRSHFWSLRCSQWLLFLPSSTYLPHSITITLLTLSTSKCKSLEIRDCILFTGFSLESNS